MIDAENMMREALDMFAKDPPDSDFQEGYLCALLVFAHECLGFRWDDPSLVQCESLLSGKPAAEFIRKRFDVIDGGKP